MTGRTASFQVGLVRDKIVADANELTLKTIKTLACNFIDEKFPEHGMTRLSERLMIFRHDYNSTNVLQVGVGRGAAATEAGGGTF